MSMKDLMTFGMELKPKPKEKKAKKYYKCKGCGKIFPDKKTLGFHIRTNRWEFFYEVNKDSLIECKMCNEQFTTLLDFQWHWKLNPWHDNKALGKELFKSKKENKREWVVRPIHRMKVRRHIKNDKEKEVLRRNKDVTKLMFKDMMHGFKYDEMDVIEIVGPPGHGKSVVGLYLAAWLQYQGWLKFGYVPKIHISHSYSDTQNVAAIAKKGDIIMQDEDPEAVGEGANWQKKNIENLMKTMRAAEIHYIFISPRNLKYLWNQQFILEAYEKDLKNRENRLAMYDSDQYALGWVYLPILDDDDPIMKDYLAKKMKNIERLQREGGSFSTEVSENKVQTDMNTVFDFITKSGMYSHTYMTKMSLDEIIGLVSELTTGTGNYTKSVARLVKRKLADPYFTPPDEPRKKQVVETDKGVKFHFDKTFSANDLRVLDEMYDFATPVSEHEKLGHLWWKYYMKEGIKQVGAAAAINEELGTDYSRPAFLNTFFPAFTGRYECLGRPGELAIQKLYFQNYKHEGGKSDPDLTAPDKSEIVEVKVRPTDDQRSPEAYIKEDEYIQEYIDKKHPIKVVVVRYARKQCHVEIHEIVYEEDSS